MKLQLLRLSNSLDDRSLDSVAIRGNGCIKRHVDEEHGADSVGNLKAWNGRNVTNKRREQLTQLSDSIGYRNRGVCYRGWLG